MGILLLAHWFIRFVLSWNKHFFRSNNCLPHIMKTNDIMHGWDQHHEYATYRLCLGYLFWNRKKRHQKLEMHLNWIFMNVFKGRHRFLIDQTHCYLEKKNTSDFVNSEKKTRITIKQVEYCSGTSDPFEMRQCIKWQRLLEQLLVVSIWTVHPKWDICVYIYNGWRSPANVAKHENLIWIKIKLIVEYKIQWPNANHSSRRRWSIFYIWKCSNNCCNPQAIDVQWIYK